MLNEQKRIRIENSAEAATATESENQRPTPHYILRSVQYLRATVSHFTVAEIH